ncbi:uncharacterized protein LOC119268175 isoform X11 [Triticum dicoccoides]|uniref:uncharacterized protein LOC119268175 isoform X11 n=1 Tax=Triticum dicoccoides TaxID=85692 RepID=UPI00188E0341|nr:uncharacterized protein LOC119268175 isoform X11 [Triticum dicoccoides]
MAPPLFSPLASAASSPPPRRRPLPPPPPSLLRHHTVLPASVGVQLTAALAGGRWRPQLMHKLASPWRRSRAAPAPRHPLLPSSAGGLRGHHLGRCCLFHPAGGARGEQQQRGQATSGRVCGGAHIRPPEGKEQRSERRSNQRRRKTRPLSYVPATSPTASARTRCKQLGVIKKRVSIAQNRKVYIREPLVSTQEFCFLRY